MCEKLIVANWYIIPLKESLKISEQILNVATSNPEKSVTMAALDVTLLEIIPKRNIAATGGAM